MSARLLGPAIFLAAFSGCHHVPRPAATGAGSFAFVEAPEPPEPKAVAAHPTTQAGEITAPPEAYLPLAKPVYPPAMLRMHVGRVTIGVRITIDEHGRVVDIGPSPLTFSTPTRFDEPFRTAVAVALAKWRFQPAVLQRFEPARGVNGGDVLFLKESHNVEWTADVTFTFTASGDVL